MSIGARLEMSTRLYIGNLSFAMTDPALHEIIGRLTSVSPEHVEHAEIIRDPETGRSRGFGFVDMASPEDAQRAINELDGTEVMGRTLRVQLAKPRTRSRRTF
jgi:RNA recognition motif-containing protein